MGEYSMIDREIGRWSAERMANDRRLRHEEPAPLITISRQLGAGGREVARGVAERLRWPVHDSELVDEIVRHAHVSKHLVSDLDEHAPHEIEAWLESIITHELFDCEDYRHALVEVLHDLAARGSAIVLGRGVNFIPRVHPRLDVRVVAPLDVRVARLMNRDGFTDSQAHAAVRRSDHERREFTRRVHGADWDDPAKYDLVINTGCLSLTEAVELTETTWRDLQRQVRSRLGPP
jgi:cytidylate kinase